MTTSDKLCIGDRYGRLTILSDLGLMPTGKKGVMIRHAHCRCDCGECKPIQFEKLRSGNTSSCGCLRLERVRAAATKHGKRNHPLYAVYDGMLARCHNINHASYIRYGARGIRVCDEWSDDFTRFYDWCLSHGWRKGLQLDRINNDGDYAPGNVRFVSPRANNRNKSVSKYWFINGVRYECLSDAARANGISNGVAHRWCDGYTTRQGNFKPPKPNCYSIPKYPNPKETSS